MMTSQPSPLTVAISGHRPNRLHIGLAETRRRIAWVLAVMQRGSKDRKRIAVSALAEGSDRMFAEAALDCGFALKVLLPFASQDYETTFADASETPRYRSLLANAQSVSVLHASLADTKSAYEAAGRATVDAAAVLVAVWDGQPAAGRGGTPEIIEYAVKIGKPVVWIDAAQLRLPRVIVSRGPDGANENAVSAVLADATPAKRRALEALTKAV